MNKHTNGPWTIPEHQWDDDSPESFKSLIRIADANGRYDVAYAADDSERMRSNATLIAAAPALLEALRPFANFACDVPCDCHNCGARAAIAKATA